MKEDSDRTANVCWMDRYSLISPLGQPPVVPLVFIYIFIPLLLLFLLTYFPSIWLPLMCPLAPNLAFSHVALKSHLSVVSNNWRFPSLLSIRSLENWAKCIIFVLTAHCFLKNNFSQIFSNRTNTKRLIVAASLQTTVNCTRLIP